MNIARNLTKKNSQLSKRLRRFYKSLPAANYIVNQRDANNTRKMHHTTLLPLHNSNHGVGTTDEIELFGIPHGNDWENPNDRDIFVRSLERNHPDLVFLQMSPCNFLSRQRFLSHKSAQEGVEDYEMKGVYDLNPEKPLTWEEAIVNLVSLDMLDTNTVYDDTNLAGGLSTYSYPHHLDPNLGGKPLLEKFVRSINTNIVGRDISEYNIINQALYQSLMGKHKVLLGGMPEILYRRMLANSLSLTEMKDMFRFIMQKIEEMEEPISFKEAAENIFPHIFKMPKDLYQTALLKESFQAATSIVAFVGIHQYVPIQHYWQPVPHGINYSEATRIPDKIVGERDEELIEKHALLDSLLEDRAWGESFIVNPFPYISEDITDFSPKDLQAMKECFLFHYKKYESFKKMSEKVQIPTYEERKIALMKNERGKKNLQLLLEYEDGILENTIQPEDKKAIEGIQLRNYNFGNN